MYKRFNQVSSYIGTASQHGRTKAVTQFVSGIFVMMILSHVACCLWTRAEVHTVEGTFNTYVNSLYYLVTTASSTGYGDVTVEDPDGEVDSPAFVYALIAIMSGMQYFGLFLTLNWKLWGRLHSYTVKVNAEKEELEDWFAARNQISESNISWSYEQSVKCYHSLLASKDIISKLTYGNYLEKLPVDCQRAVQFHSVYDLISTFEILKSLPKSMTIQIALSFSLRQ